VDATIIYKRNLNESVRGNLLISLQADDTHGKNPVLACEKARCFKGRSEISLLVKRVLGGMSTG
jgi:hypothetical protein